MGYVSSLSVSEFRSIEYLLDELCKVVMAPVVRSFDVSQRSIELGGVPGILYEPRRSEPEGVILYLHGGGFIGTSPTMYAYFTAYLAGRPDARCSWPTTGSPRSFRSQPDSKTRPRSLRPSPNAASHPSGSSPGDSAGGGLAVEVVQAAPRNPQLAQTGGADPLLARSRHDPRRTLGHRERGDQHLAVEHSHLVLPSRPRPEQQVGVGRRCRPHRVPADLPVLGR